MIITLKSYDEQFGKLCNRHYLPSFIYYRLLLNIHFVQSAANQSSALMQLALSDANTYVLKIDCCINSFFMFKWLFVITIEIMQTN